MDFLKKVQQKARTLYNNLTKEKIQQKMLALYTWFTWKNVKTAVLTFFKDIWYFLSSKIFLKNFSVMAILAVACWVGLFYWMARYTHHGENITVPDLKGMTVAQVSQRLEGTNLKYKVIDSIYRKGAAQGSILEQSPTGTSKVKVNRTIYLTANAFDAPDVRLPRIWGKDIHVVEEQLRVCCDIEIDSIKKVWDRAENTILEVRHNGEILKDPGHNGKLRLPRFSKIGVTIARGVGSRVSYPKLTCMELEVAKFLITGSQLKVGSIIKDSTVIDPSTAYVVRQTPKYRKGGSLGMGRKITLHLTQHAPENCKLDPDFQ